MEVYASVLHKKKNKNKDRVRKVDRNKNDRK